jgi:uncharacterized protein (TIGR02597 family)
MKNPLHLFFAIAITASNALADSPTTATCGFVSVTIPAGSVASPSYTAMSIPLYGVPAFHGTVSSVDSATQITLSGAVWTAGQFASTGMPHLAKVTSGVNVGRAFLITANGSRQLTLSLATAPTITDLRIGLAVGDTIAILPARTLGNVFGTTSPLLVTGSSASMADNVYLLDGPGPGWSTYYHNGTNWRKAGAIGSQDNTILYPDEGILVVHVGSAPVSLDATGLVPATAEKTDISGTGSTFAAQRFPVDIQLSAVGFQATAGWITGGSANVADNVWAWSASLKKWEQFYYNGSNWRKAGSIANQNTRILAAGTSVIVTRIGTTLTTTLSQTLPYVP